MNKVFLILACLLLSCEHELSAAPRNRNPQEKQQAAVNSPSPIVNQTSVNNTAEDASESYRKERDAKDDVFREEQVRQGRIVAAATERLFLVTMFYVVVTAIYAFVAFLTLRQIKKQAFDAGEQLKVIGKQSRTMLGTWQVMRRQAEAMERQLETISKQEIHLADQVEAAKQAAETAKSQLVAMQGQLSAMEKQEATMRESLDETRKAIRYSEAAYISVHDANLTQYEIGKPIQAGLVFKNDGNTPAYNVRTYSHIQLRNSSLPNEMSGLTEARGMISQHIIGPNGGERVQYVETSGLLDSDVLVQITLGIHRFYVWGIVIYEDIFGHERWTKFCLVQRGNSTTLDSCENNNEADDHERIKIEKNVN